MACTTCHSNGHNAATCGRPRPEPGRRSLRAWGRVASALVERRPAEHVPLPAVAAPRPAPTPMPPLAGLVAEALGAAVATAQRTLDELDAALWRAPVRVADPERAADLLAAHQQAAAALRFAAGYAARVAAWLDEA